jgi:hypothetical protein
MDWTRLLSAAAAIVSLALAGCSSDRSASNIQVSDGAVIYKYEKSGRDYKIGSIDGDQVSLYDMYGGFPMALKDVETAVAAIPGEGLDDVKSERRALIDALASQGLHGIWIVENAEIDGQSEPVRKDDPSYIILRADKTFRIVKKGQKTSGIWSLESLDQLILKADETVTAQVARPAGDKLELTILEGGQVFKLRYARTNLTEEPQAADE